MSSRIVENTAIEVKTEVDDLKAFAGLEFSDSHCDRCGSHLAVKGTGTCTLCLAELDSVHREALEFDPELSDAINGMGSSLVW